MTYPSVLYQSIDDLDTSRLVVDILSHQLYFAHCPKSPQGDQVTELVLCREIGSVDRRLGIGLSISNHLDQHCIDNTLRRPAVLLAWVIKVSLDINFDIPVLNNPIVKITDAFGV
ncbi:hypothetical protein D3C73_1453510 [compost metagenome]